MWTDKKHTEMHEDSNLQFTQLLCLPNVIYNMTQTLILLGVRLNSGSDLTWQTDKLQLKVNNYHHWLTRLPWDSIFCLLFSPKEFILSAITDEKYKILKQNQKSQGTALICVTCTFGKSS